MTPRRSHTGPSLIDVVRRRTAEYPSRPAFTFLDSAGAEAEALTRGELEARSLTVAAALQGSGAAGERVLLLHPPGLGFITSFLGCLYAGAVAVPAYPPGRNRPAARLRSIAADARPRVVLAPSGLEPGAVTSRVPELADALWIATDALDPALAGAWRETSPGPDDPAFLQYTSGSTSEPKGVVVTHGSLVHNEEAIRRAFGQSEASVVVGWLPLYHDMGLIGNVLQPLYTGARAVLMAPLSFLQRPALWLEAVSRYRATTSGGPNFAYDLCVRKMGEEEKAGLDLSSWTVAFNGAEPVRADTLERFAAAFAVCGFRREAFFPCYGLAEATLFVTGGSPGEPPVVRAVEGPGSRERVGCGRAALDLEVIVADPEVHTVCEPGRVGEIWVAGPSVAAGYWGRPEETARTFQARLADGRGPFLRTGDLGLLADGELFVTGRIKDLIILRGRNLYPQDLERTAEESHPALRPGGGAAFAIERGGEERLVILHEVERSAGADPARLAEALEAVRRAVAEEHEVAMEEIVLLRGGTILKTSSGKIRRSACRAAYLAGELAVVARSGPSPDPALGSGVVVPPPLGGRAVGSGGGQEGGFSLAEEAARVLRRRVEEIDPDAPLIALGLDSLGAAELRSAIESRMGATVSMTALLEGVSLRELESLVRAGGQEVRSPLASEPDLPGEHPLSEGQRDLWVLDRLSPAAAAGNLAGAAWLPGGIDGAALERALVLLADRHAAFRTTFEVREGEPVRRVHERLDPDFREERTGEEELAGLLVAEAFQPFELERGPLLRVRVWTLPDGRMAMLLAVHHLIVDFASAAVLLRDLAALYDQERGGETARPGPPGPGLTAWIRHREAALAGPREERLRAFWHQRLAGELPVLDLPADRPRPVPPSWRGRAGSVHVDGVAGALRQVGQARGATLFGSLLAGFQAVLHRWSGQDEVLVGAPTSIRGGLDGEVGYFVNPVVLRLGLTGEPGFADLAGRAGAEAVEAFEHGDYPFPRLARELGAQRGAGRPLFQAMLALQPTRHPEERALALFALGEAGARVTLGGIEMESIALAEIRVQVDLTLMAAETEGGGLSLALQLDADLFDEATAGRLLGHLAAFLSGAADDPERPVTEVEILAPAERSQIAAWSAAPPLQEPPDVCLHELIARQALLTPGAVAVEVGVEGGEERLTYDELWRRSVRLAARLRSLGVGPEVRVGVCAERGPGMVVGLLAVLEAGGAYVPLDPAYPSERLSLLLADSGARLALTTAETDGRLPAPELPRVRIDEVPETTGEPAMAVPPSPGNLAYLIYTSGSTGRPKAVAVEHRSAVALARWARRAFSDRELDGVLATTSIGFDLSVLELFVPLCWGGRVVVASSILDLPDLPPSAGVRLVNTVPSALAEVLRAGGLRALPETVETVNLAGEPLRRDLVQALYGAGVRRVVNLYGPSEDTTYSTVAEQEADAEGDPPIGRPVDGSWARVLDGGLRPVPLGVAGELFLGGAGLARGYLGRPELTAERFVPSPFSEEGAGSRLYRTGDRARWRPDGELLYLGRLDHQVKIRGFRVEPGEIEAVLAAHPEVEQAVVLAQGEGGERRLVAYVIPTGERSGQDLRAWLEERLPGSLVPSVFVLLESFPRTPNGKVDRRALSELTADLAPAPAAVPRTPPRTPLEAALAAIWSEVLGVPEVGIYDRFFDLGGHSLLAVRLLARVRERLGVDLPLTAVFQAPTVAGLARLAAAAPSWRLPPPVPLPRDGSPFPLSFAQERMWLLHRLDPESPAYHVAAEVRLTGPLDLAALAAALDDLVRCHEVLRTRFPEGEGGPVQVVEPVSALALPVIGLSGLPAEIRSAEAERLSLAAARRPFDLAAAPPVRALLLRLDGGEHRLLLTLHHAAADEASLDILSRDLGTAYEALSRGLPSPLAPPPLQMADVAVWQRGRMAGEPLAARLAWWEERLAGLPALDLPADRPLPAAPGWRGGMVARPLPDATAAALSAIARDSGATLFMVLLAAFEGLLARLSGAEDFAVGSPFSIRDRRELEGVAGPLLNSLVLRADVAGDPPFRELVRRVRETTVAAHERADLPFELLVERLRPERRAGANPLFDVAFILHRPPGARRATGLEMAPRALPTGAVKFDLALYALETAEGIELALEHAADRWDEATAVRLLGHLTTLLAGAAADPGRRLSELLPLTPAERRAVVAAMPPAAAGVSRTRLTPIEELLAGIWEDLLGVERPGPGDDFFALGGQSLLAARVVSRLRQALGVELPLRALFEEKTLAGMAARVESARHAGALERGDGEPPLMPVPREGGLPLSFGQERLWFLDRLDPGSPVYNMPGAVRLTGELDPERLRAALEGIAARHEVLRSAFPAPDGEPVQVARPAAGLPLPRVDLSGLPLEARCAETLRRTTAEALRPFDLETWPPLRATLLRLDEREHVLLLTVHHIAFDGWSLGVLLRELVALYGKDGEGLPELPVQYADFAVWQRRLLDGDALAGSIAWWRERLAGAPPLLALPLDRPRPPIQTFRGGSLRLALAPETARAVRRLGCRFEATSFMTLLAAWGALLSRFTGETDLVVGTAAAGRDRVELEPLIGLFAGNLALRLDLSGDPDVAGLLARARETTLSAWSHREVPFERLVRELRPERDLIDLSHAPLYQAVLTLDASDRPPLALPGLHLEAVPVDSGTAKFDLALYLEEQGGGLAGLLEYNRDLFDATTAARLLDGWERLVEGMPRAPESRVSALPLLSEAEARQVRTELAGEEGALAPEVLVPRRIANRAAEAPDSAAVSAAGRLVTYGELDRRAARLARRLRALGVGPEVRVAVCLDRSPELIVALLGIWKAGGVYVPLDPTQPEERLAWITGDCRAAVLLASWRGPVPPPVGAPAVLFLDDLRGEDTGGVEAPLLPESAAYLIYTSGSTGRPKGVVVSHGALAAYAEAMAGLYGIGPADRVLQSASPGFDLSLDEIVPCLAGGAELALRDDAMLASAAAFFGGCGERGITAVSLPTAVWHEIVADLESLAGAAPPSLRLVILGGERLLPERLAAWRRQFGGYPRLLNTYGPTEATILVTAADLSVSADAPEREAPLGRPVPGAGIWLLGRHGETVPPGAPGEIAVGGAFLARGYLGQPDRTAERFVPHPFSAVPGARVYRTGDLGRLLASGLEFAGRIDDQVKVRGYRVEPGEVEAVLSGHPRIAAAVVVVRESEGRRRLVGYLVPRQPAPSAVEVRAFLAARLPEPLVPSELVFLDALPLTPHGKVDRRALPAPAAPSTSAEAVAVAPRDAAEEEVAAVWREVLGRERVGIHDNFFDLGGHSLLLARVHVLLRERLGREVPMVDLFRYPTVAALARHLALSGPPPPASSPGPWGLDAETVQARLSLANAAFLRFAAGHPETLEGTSFAPLAEHAAATSPYPLQPWPVLVDRARVEEMERVSVGLVRLVKSLPRRVFGNDPERLRDFYGLASADLARSLVAEPSGLAEVIGRGDFLDTAGGLKCLELNLVSDLGGWQAPLWAEGYQRVPLWQRFVREQGLRVACRDTVALLFEHVAATARPLGEEDGAVNAALVLPAGAPSLGPELEAWLGDRYAAALRRVTPSAAGTLLLLPYSELRERGGRLWAGGRRVHAAVEIHHEGTAAQALRCFKAGTLALFNAPVRAILTDKRNIALLSELADRSEVLTPAERALVQRHVPWTRRLAAAEASWRGGTVWLPELVLEARPELVLKRAREGRGAAVYLGSSTPEAVWRERVEQALADGDWVVQERVEPLPSVHQRGEHGWDLHDAVWGLFVFGERYGGAFLSLQPREQGGVVNLTQGASAGVVFEVLEDSVAAEPAARNVPERGVAIVGMAGRFPGAAGVERFWDNLVAGVESVRFFPREELAAAGVDPELLDDPAYVPARAVLDGVELFDAELFGVSPREAETMDPQHRLLLECAWEALEHAGYDPRRYDGPVGVYAGAGPNTYLLFNLASDRERLAAVGPVQAMLGNGADFLATRLSYKLGLRGPSLTVQTACSTSLVAVHLAAQALLHGECDMALAGGVRVSVPRRAGYLYQPDGILSPDGHCRPFDAEAQGSVDGEGAGIVVLKRLADALADGDHIQAVILGTAVNNDGAGRVGYTAPGVDGQAGVIAAAQAAAGVRPESIGLVEAHGTATPLGDPVEVAALRQVFETAAVRRGSVALGSVKGNVGHLDTAAGVTSLIKAILALEREVIPPTLHFQRANPLLGLEESPFHVPAEPRPWPAGPQPRRAGVSSFGMGGTNAHVVLEEAPPLPPAGGPSRPWQLLVLSAATPSALEAVVSRLADHLAAHPELDLADVAYTLQVGRQALAHRRFVVCRDTADAVRALAPSPIPSPSPGEGEEVTRLHELGRQWLAGSEVDWRGLHAGERRRRVPLPTYPFERRRYWVETRPETAAAVLTAPLGEAVLPQGSVPEVPTVRRSRPSLAGAYVPPRDERELRLAGLFQEVLGFEPVGAFDSFFELGGHSLLGLQLLSRIRAELGAEVQLEWLFQAITVADLAELLRLLEEERTGTAGTIAAATIPRLDPESRSAELPLSFAQERLWFLDRFDPGTPTFNLTEAVHLRGPLEVPLLARALAEVVRRHESLRTAFASHRPVQRVLPAVEVPLPLVDLSALPDELGDLEIERLATRAGDIRFDLTRPPLLAAWLYRLAPDRHAVALVLHHIVGDGWSIGVLISELAEIYRAWAAGEPSPLPELPVQYPDFTVWQRSSQRQEEMARQLVDWRRQLAGPLPVLDLPIDRPRPAVQTFRGAVEPLRLTPDLAGALRALGTSQGATPFMVLLAAFGAVLSRWSGQQDLIVGSPIAGRDRRELEGLIGIFLNMLPLRLDLSAGPGFRELVARAREVAVAAYSRQDVPVERLIQEVQPERDLSRSPLFQVLLNLQDFPHRAFELPGGLTMTPLPMREMPSRFDLTLYGEPAEDGGMALDLVYNADLFDGATMRQFLGQLHHFLCRAMEEPELPVSRISLISPDQERAAAAVLPDPRLPPASTAGEWNGAVHERFLEQARRDPARLAVVDAGTAWMYGDLAETATALAGRLRAVGIGHGDVVAVHAHRSAPLVQALLGVLMAGAAFLVLDPAHPAARRRSAVLQARPGAWIDIEAAGPLPAELAAAVPDALPRLRLGFSGEIHGDEGLADPSLPAVGPGDLAYFAFTSGSTGEPKGILGTHGPLSHFCAWHAGQLGLGEDDRFSLLSGLSHDPLLRDVFVPLGLGATLCIPDADDLGSPSRLAGWLARHGITVCHLTPALGQVLTEGGVALPGLRLACFGGDVLTERDVARLRAMAPAATCVNFYGTTETPQAISWFVATGAGDWPARRVPIGRGINGVQLLVVNEAGDLAAPGELGEVCVRTPHLSLGYLGDGRLTAERFVIHPWTDGPEDRLYRTGDLGRYRADGAVVLAGRRDGQVQVRGFRVEPAEVEAALALHPAVREAAVLLRKVSGADGADGADGDGREVLTAWLVAPDGAPRPADGELREILRQRLPDPMVPEAFVWLERLPLTPNGKLDRRALPEPLPPAGEAAQAADEPPADPVEEWVAELWQELLGLEKVGRHDNFFDLGGHSIVATRVVSRLEQDLGVEIPLRSLFETPTVAGLADRIVAAGMTAVSETAEAAEPVES